MVANCIQNVAIVGAAGNSGKHMTASLTASGRHTVTALTRADSKTSPPAGCRVAVVDYSDNSSLITALRGQDVLIITLGVMAPEDTQAKLIRAAGEAGVPWIMPNEWAPDVSSPGVRSDVMSFERLQKTREYIMELGKSSFIALSCGFWYEWSLAIPTAYGFDFDKKEAVFFDEGDTKISTSTWPQVGRAVAALMSLPITAESGPCLESYRNQNVFTNSFTLSQKEMLESILRVTGDELEDWKITKEPARERVANAKKAMQAGNRREYAKVMYTRIFYDDGVGNYEAAGKLANNALKLPKDELDAATKAAIERAKEFKW